MIKTMNKVKTLKDRQAFEGIVTISNYEISDNPKAREIDKLLRKATPENMNRTMYNYLLKELGLCCQLNKTMTAANRVVQSGREVFARRMVADNTYSGELTHGLLGDDTTAVADTDIALGNEVARKTIASRGRSGDQVTVDFYYSQNDTDGTYEEFGTAIDGTNTAGSGQLYNRLLTGGWTKTATESMTVSIQFNLNAS